MCCCASCFGCPSSHLCYSALYIEELTCSLKILFFVAELRKEENFEKVSNWNPCLLRTGKPDTCLQSLRTMAIRQVILFSQRWDRLSQFKEYGEHSRHKHSPKQVLVHRHSLSNPRAAHKPCATKDHCHSNRSGTQTPPLSEMVSRLHRF
jgi:hypothetical protein